MPPKPTAGLFDRFEAVRRLLIRHPVAGALLVGAALRLATVLMNPGWFGLDDYVYAIEPAWRWLGDPSLDYPSSLRSTLLTRVVYGCMRLADAVGLDGPGGRIRGVYAVLGAWSLLAIPAAHRLARRSLGEAAAVTAAWLTAAQALMPLISTRALIEVVAIPPLLWGLVFVDAALADERPVRRLQLSGLGAVLLAAAAMIRFQVGLVYVAVVGFAAWQAFARRRQVDARTGLAPLFGVLLAGMFGLLAAAAIDVAEGRAPLATVTAYLSFNVESSARFGVSAWYTYLLQLLAYTVPPVTLLLARPLWRAARRTPMCSLALALFVVAHSLVGHKEDRFLFPMLPILFVLLGAALAELRRGSVWQRRGYRAFWAINAIALLVVVTSDAQRNLTVPLRQIARQGGTPSVAVVGLLNVPAFYAGDGARIARLRWPPDLRARLGDPTFQPDFILFRPEPDTSLLKEVAAAGLRCGEPQVYEGDLVDRALVALNPRHNKRRAATALVACDRR